MTKSIRNNAKVGFILDHPLMHYRRAFFQQLASAGFEITIFHSGEILNNIEGTTQTRVEIVKYRGIDFRKLPSFKSFDIIVCMQNMRLINLWLLSLNPFRTFKLIHWGIGVSSSRGLNPNRTFISEIRNLLAKCASAQILYSPYALHLFSSQVRLKTFIANNTVDNPSSANLSSESKDGILFIGALNRRKGLDILVRSFLRFVEEYKPLRIRMLRIIGEGEMKQQLIEIIEGSQYKSLVKFVGKLEDNRQKLEYFSSSVACVSPKQAGLSVLESFSYGVPFVSFTDCISGGEHLNIVNGYNGYLVSSEDDLIEIFRTLDANSELGRQLGENAFNYYNSKRKMENMVSSFEEALNYVLKNKN